VRFAGDWPFPGSCSETRDATGVNTGRPPRTVPVRLSARAEAPGNLTYPLAYLDQAFCCEAHRGERIAADAIGDRVQDGVARFRQVPCVQFGYVDLADLVVAFAGGPGLRGLECFPAGA
jgi:hypothetical protein